MSGELEPQRDHLLAKSVTDREIPRSWVYWSISIGLALALLVLLTAVVIPLPHHVHHLGIADAFNIAWKIALLPPGAVTARIAIDRINLSKREHEHAVQVARSTDYDAAQRRITEISAKASDQLGSDKATVRIGGLTDLERLGQNNSDLRQTVADRICAYLQMPYTVPAAGPEGHEKAARVANPDGQTGPRRVDDPVTRQERQVRWTAQRILARHTRWELNHDYPPDAFWPGLNLDLAGATLIDLYMNSSRVAIADFVNGDFHEEADFSEALFSEYAAFDGATFGEDVYFTGTAFEGGMSCSRATFEGKALFRQVTFAGGTYFQNVTFRGEVDFKGAQFEGDTRFDHTEFNGASFEGATFSKFARFTNAKFGWIAIGDGTVVSMPDATSLTVDPISRRLTMQAHSA